jgi:hypothetical protein
MGQGKERRNAVTTADKGVGQTNSRKEETWAGTSTEDAIRKSSQATFCIINR